MTVRTRHAYLALLLFLFSTVVFQPGAKAEDAVTTFYQVAIAPDGRQIAWVQPLVNENGRPLGGSTIYVSSLTPNSSLRRISAAPDSLRALDESIAWSADSRQLAFLSNGGGPSPQMQLYVADVSTGAARKLTSLTGDMADPAWSPDGKSIAFLFIENAPRSAGPLMPMAAETGVIENKVFEQRLAIMDAATGTMHTISPPDMYVYEFAWSPDSKSFALAAAHGAGDANWYVAQLYTLDSASGQMKSLYQPSLQIANPVWSPDGRQIAFISGIMSDEGVTGGDIFVISASGGKPKNITPDIPSSPANLHWLQPNRIQFAENIDGNTGMGQVEVSSGKVKHLWNGAETISANFFGEAGVSFSVDGTAAFIASSTDQPPEVWAGPIGQWRQITHNNDALQPSWGQMKSLHWTNNGIHVQGWLMYPKNYDANKKYPMVVVPHGGPASSYTSRWPGDFFNTPALSTRGYFVFYPNPRGSYGQGEAFARANVKDFGYGDFHDILAGIDEIVRTLPVDNDRIGITGWSYGGYMTMWAVTQTNRFRAAVSGAGLANFQSYYGQNDIDEWMIPYFGASVYDDPAVYARSSPITFIKNAKTPTLLLVGERDGECPAPQSREFWHALKTLGVETQLVIYPGEGHAFLNPQHRQDIMDRMIAWFDHYLKPQTAEHSQ